MGKEDIFTLLRVGKQVSIKAKRDGLLNHGDVTKKTVQIDEGLVSDRFSTRWKVHGSHLVSNTPRMFPIEYYTGEGDGKLEDGKLKHEKVHDINRDKKVKIAGFDLDGTLVETRSGMKFARGEGDWRWWGGTHSEESKVVGTIIKLVQEKYVVVIFTNQGGVIAKPTSKSYLSFTKRVNGIVEAMQRSSGNEAFQPLVFGALKRPGSSYKDLKKVSSVEQHQQVRKPATGMWEELVRYFETLHHGIDKENSFFVGDAAGRSQDFLDSDEKFAENIGIEFKTPNEFFK